MENLELCFLISCHESIARRGPLLADLAASLHVCPEALFYLWAERKCPQRGSFRAKEWSYFFHGYECDLRHADDGRFLRIDFGPHGDTGTFTSWGVAQFVMTSKSPWRDFPELKAHLAIHAPPYDEQSASLERTGLLSDRLERAGLITPADRELLTYAEGHTTRNDEGIQMLRLPAGTPERTYFDIAVAGRKRISEAGERLLAARARQAAATN